MRNAVSILVPVQNQKHVAEIVVDSNAAMMPNHAVDDSAVTPL